MKLRLQAASATECRIAVSAGQAYHHRWPLQEDKGPSSQTPRLNEDWGRLLDRGSFWSPHTCLHGTGTNQGPSPMLSVTRAEAYSMGSRDTRARHRYTQLRCAPRRYTSPCIARPPLSPSRRVEGEFGMFGIPDARTADRRAAETATTNEARWLTKSTLAVVDGPHD